MYNNCFKQFKFSLENYKYIYNVPIYYIYIGIHLFFHKKNLKHLINK